MGRDAGAGAGVRGAMTARPWLAVGVPCLVHLLMCLLVADWVMDDAGISYAYARNIALGHGPVSQPGRPPVEGYSNFLWVMLLAVLMAAKLFHPVVTVKIAGAALTCAALALVSRTLRRGGVAPGAALLATTLAGACAPVVIWTQSGLENSLTLLLGVAAWRELSERGRSWTWNAGVLTALLAMNHPENALYVGAGGLVCLAPALAGRAARRGAIADTAKYGAAFGVLFAPFMLLRLHVFGLPFPHTYYAKRTHPSLVEHLLDLVRHPGATLDKFIDLCTGMMGPAGVGLVPLGIAAAVWLLAHRRLPRAVAAALAFEVVAIGTYLWIDQDWMGEYRFATLGTTFSIAVLVAAAAAPALVEATALRAARIPRQVLGAALAAVLLVAHVPRTVRFALNPPTSYADVSHHFARKFETYARLIGHPGASVLIPDIGALLWESPLRVYDVAGLIEPDAIRTLKKGTVFWHDEHPEFFDWVFEELRPTFINTHDFFTRITAFDRDPRFERDYVAVNAYRDGWVERNVGLVLRSGDFVRRDAASPEVVERLRAAYSGPAAPAPWVERLVGWPAAATVEDVDRLMKDGLRMRYEEHAPARAAARFRKVLELNPTHFGAAYQLAAALDAAGRAFEARLVWETVEARAAELGEVTYVAMAQERLRGHSMQAGRRALEAGKPALAIAHFQRVLDARPEDRHALVQMSRALELAGRADEARAMWHKATEAARAADEAPNRR